jgi:RimJ/RimL family protein N-acetyltransferase
MAQKRLICSSRLSLYKFDSENPQHCHFLFTLWNTPLFIQSEGKTAVDSIEKAKQMIENRFLAEYRRNGYGAYFVGLNEASSDEAPVLIGTVGLTKGDSPTSFTVPDIGFATLPIFCGKGYASEAAELLLDYARQEFGLKDVFGFSNPGNMASRRVLEKCGFEFRGVKELQCFGGIKGVVYVLPHMAHDLSVYGLDLD